MPFWSKNKIVNSCNGRLAVKWCWLEIGRRMDFTVAVYLRDINVSRFRYLKSLSCNCLSLNGILATFNIIMLLSSARISPVRPCHSRKHYTELSGQWGVAFPTNSKPGIKKFGRENCHDLGSFHFDQTTILMKVLLARGRTE